VTSSLPSAGAVLPRFGRALLAQVAARGTWDPAAQQLRRPRLPAAQEGVVAALDESGQPTKPPVMRRTWPEMTESSPPRFCARAATWNSFCE